jgi:hypothetical protein
VEFSTSRKTSVSRSTRARRGLRRRLGLVQKQVLARYIIYFALPVTAMFAIGFALDGSRRAITLVALLALMPALLMASISRREPIAPWVARRIRRREVELLERLWASSPHPHS